LIKEEKLKLFRLAGSTENYSKVAKCRS